MSNIEEYYIYNKDFSLLVIDNQILVSPDYNTVINNLWEMHKSMMIFNCTFHLSDALMIEKNILTIHLGYLIISFVVGAPCPAFYWTGQPCSEFDLLANCFDRFNKLKAFW
jgi:hypothetical protein